MTKDDFSLKILECERTLYRISMSMLKNETDCEDAVQMAILTAFEKLDTLKNEQYFKTWLVRILINVCNKQLNERKKLSVLRTQQKLIPLLSLLLLIIQKSE